MYNFDQEAFEMEKWNIWRLWFIKQILNSIEIAESTKKEESEKTVEEK